MFFVFNKDKIIIDEYLSGDDVDDMVYFFNTNVNLKKIIFLCFALLQNDKYATFVLNVDAFLRL